MRWTHIPPSAGRAMPWKNGGGTTLELLVEPPGATAAQGFAWRVSSAEVATSGPFSAFPGLERWLVLLEGPGFELDFESRGREVLSEPLQAVRFSGDWPASATLLGGPSTDFNLMVDPTRWTARVAAWRGAGTQRWAVGPASLLFLAGGTLHVPVLGLHLGRRHLLRLEGDGERLDLVPGLAGVALLRVDLEPCPLSR